MKSWRTRYFVLQRSMLFYFEFEGAEEPIGDELKTKNNNIDNCNNFFSFCDVVQEQSLWLMLKLEWRRR